jgi:hypothetical protein
MARFASSTRTAIGAQSDVAPTHLYGDLFGTGPGHGDFPGPAARLGVCAALTVFALSLAYAVPLVLGLRALPSPQDPIPDPYFAIMELLILASAPVLVAMMAAIHAYAARDAKVYSLTALIFMGLLAGTTCAVHIVMLTVGRQVTPVDLPWLPVFLSFRWPSVIYALDILAWDLFYPLAILFAAPVFRGRGLARAVRVCMVVSGALSLAGLLGPVVGDMGIRNIGIVGYAGVLPVVAVLLALVFRRAGEDAASPRESAASVRGSAHASR